MIDEVIRTVCTGNGETIKLTAEQCRYGVHLGIKHRIVRENGGHSWRATVRAVLSGKFDLVPKAPGAPRVRKARVGKEAAAGS